MEYVDQNREVKTRTGRLSGDRGASLTEGAMIAPLFFLLLFAVIEFGVTFRNKLTFEAAAQRGVRMGAIQGNARGADQQVLKDVVHFLEITPTVQDVQIIIYNAGGINSEPTDACKDGIATVNECNVYEIGDELDDSNFGCLWSLDSKYCPGDRSTASGDQQCLGVYIKAYQPFFTGFFGDGLHFTTNVVTRIESQSYSEAPPEPEPCGAKSINSSNK